MTDTGWETLSNQAIGAAGIVYFLALLVHLAEWASLREPKSAVAETVRRTSPAAGSPPRWQPVDRTMHAGTGSSSSAGSA